MTDPYEREERLAIFEFDAKMSRTDAEKLYEETMREKIASCHYADKVARIRSMGTLQKMGKRKIVDGKTLAGGGE